MIALAEAMEERKAELAEEARRRAEQAERERMQEEQFLEMIRAKFPAWLGIDLAGYDIHVAKHLTQPAAYVSVQLAEDGFVRLKNPVQLDPGTEELFSNPFAEGYVWEGVHGEHKIKRSGKEGFVKSAFLDAAMYALGLET